MTTVIKVENLSKKYLISHQKRESYIALRDVITNRVKGLFSQNKKFGTTCEDLWALKDINFEIKEGDRLGVIGRNGAGKSTLLKALSRITEPTKGRISIKGRVASLLEVGTGFHPELTGRENIFLNGAIIGMIRFEIKKKFDEIVAFAEVEKFLDTPVKYYSSGMYVRLAFAVAAHLEPEILLVDEVLAVGDINFQKKCMGKMADISNKKGKTIIFVSHNLIAIQRLCTKAVLLTSGKISAEGEADIVTNKYSNESLEAMQIPLSERIDRRGSAKIKFTSIVMQDENNNVVNFFKCGQTVKFRIFFINNCGGELKKLVVSLGIDDSKGNRVTYMNNELTDDYFDVVPPNFNSFDITIERLPLMPGRYSIELYSSVNVETADWIQNAAFFDVELGDFYHTGKLTQIGHTIFLMDYRFKLNDGRELKNKVKGCTS